MHEAYQSEWMFKTQLDRYLLAEIDFVYRKM